MAGEDLYADEDLEAILVAIDEDVWDKDDEFNAKTNSILVNIEEEPSQSGFKCDSQSKVFQGIKMQSTEKPNQRKYLFLVRTFLLRIVYIPCTSINIKMIMLNS